jgi:hypothetical protein
MSLRKESLKLYRDVMRASRLFTWPHESGYTWCEVVRRSARQEFELNRNERDPVAIAKMLFVARDCLNQTTDKYLKQAQSLNDKIDSTRTR